MASDLMLKLVVARGGSGLEKEHPMSGTVLTIGRSQNNVISMPKDTKASRHHAEIVQEGEGYLIRDLESAMDSLRAS